MNSWALARRAARSTSSIGRLRVAEADVIGDGAGEEEGVLRHQADLAVQRALGDPAHVDPVDAHRAGGDVVKAGDQVADGGLAGAGRADQCHRLPWRDGQAQVVQHLGQVGAVLEADMVEVDLAVDRRAGRLRRAGPARPGACPAA